MPRWERIAALAAPAALILALTGCGSSGSSGGGTPVSVSVHDYAFGTPSASVGPGALVTVTFVNSGPSRHSFTVDSGGQEVEAGSGETQTLTFTAPSSGNIAFHCKFHDSMHGTITVSSAGGSSQSSGSTGAGAGSGSSSSTGGGGGYGGYGG